MPKRSSRKRKPDDEPSSDENQSAFDAVRRLTQGKDEEPEKNPHAQALGRLGGLKGGKARAKKLGKKRRADIARKAARARWRKSRKKGRGP